MKMPEAEEMSLNESEKKTKKKSKKNKKNKIKEQQEIEENKEQRIEEKTSKKRKIEKEVDENGSEENFSSPSKKQKKKNKKEKKNKEKTKKTSFVPTKSVFKKCFYEPTAVTNAIPESEIEKYQSEHCVSVSGNGSELYRPILDFSEANLDKRCLKICQSFEKPTPIQSVCWPIAASGRDVIGIAETGSGKTLAFSVPALAHMIHRKENPTNGVSASPMMLVVAPTRELAMQSQEVLEKAGKKCKLRSTCVYGGVSKYSQRDALRSGVDIIVATPGRLLDLMEEGLCDLSGVSYLVLDEADRMLDQGFERDIRRIIAQTHEERQTCLFSATWPESIQKLAQEFLIDPIKVTIGSEDLAAGKRVEQIVEVVEERSRDSKIQKLLEKYHKNENRILIFVLYKKEADRVLQSLQRKGWNCTAIHGDKSQEMRIKAVEDFKSGRVPILVATDVAARGLDIPGVEYVINYSFPLTIEDYVHRIGRTGRAGKSGIAHTFFHDGDKLRAGELVNVLKESNQTVPKDMMKFDLNVKRKEHKLYGNFGPKTFAGPMKKATKITFDD